MRTSHCHSTAQRAHNTHTAYIMRCSLAELRTPTCPPEGDANDNPRH